MERKYTKMVKAKQDKQANKNRAAVLKHIFDVVLKVTFHSYFEIRKVEHPGLRHNHTVERGVVICRKPAPRD